VERPAEIVKTAHEGFRLLHLRGLYHDYYRLPMAAHLMKATWISAATASSSTSLAVVLPQRLRDADGLRRDLA